MPTLADLEREHGLGTSLADLEQQAGLTTPPEAQQGPQPPRQSIVSPGIDTYGPGDVWTAPRKQKQQAAMGEKESGPTWRAEVKNALARGGLRTGASAPGTLAALEQAVARSPITRMVYPRAAQATDLPALEQHARSLKETAKAIYDEAGMESLRPQKTGVWGYIANTTFETLPMMAAATAAGAATGGIGAFSVGAMTEGESAYQEAIKAGADEDTAQTERLVVGTINGFIERMQADEILKLGKGITRASLQAIRQAAKERALAKLGKEVGKAGLGQVGIAVNEGLEESLQEIVSIGAATMHGDKIDLSQDVKRVGKAAVGGFTAGGLLGLAGSTARTAIEGQTTEPPATPRTDAAEPGPTPLSEIVGQATAGLPIATEAAGHGQPVTTLDDLEREAGLEPQETAKVDKTAPDDAIVNVAPEVTSTTLDDLEREAGLKPEVPNATAEEAKATEPAVRAEGTRAVAPGTAQESQTQAEAPVEQAQPGETAQTGPAEPWQMTKTAYLAEQKAEITAAPKVSTVTKTGWDPALHPQALTDLHRGRVQEALRSDRPVPRAVLEEYAGEEWADAAAEATTEATEKQRRQELGKTTKFIKGHPIYGAELKGLENQAFSGAGEVRVYVPPEYNSDVEAYAGQKGRERGMWSMITNDPEKGMPWDTFAQERDWPGDFDQVMDKLQQIYEGRTRGPINEKAFERAVESKDVELEVVAMKRNLLENAENFENINDAIETYVRDVGEIDGIDKADQDAIIETHTIKGLPDVKTGQTTSQEIPGRAKADTGIFGQDEFRPSTGKAQGSLGLEFAAKGREAVPVKPELSDAVAKLAGKYETAKDLYAGELTGKNDLFNTPENPLPEIQEAWDQATKGGRMFGADPTPAPIREIESPRNKGIMDLAAFRKAYEGVIGTFEPARPVVTRHGRKAAAEVIKAAHHAEAKTLEFDETNLDSIDQTVSEFETELLKYASRDLEDVMLLRGHGLEGDALKLQKQAFGRSPKALKDSKVRRALDEIADYNYRYLRSVAGDDINQVADYFYGIYKGGRKVSQFLQHWRTTDNYLKQKVFPTYADAKAYGLEARTVNPVDNLRREFQAIARREAMKNLHDTMMAQGRGIYIQEAAVAPADWHFIGDSLRPEPAFKDVRVEPTMARLINSLISTNKITQNKVLDTFRRANNAMRSLKFMGSAFHAWQITKQSIADTGYLGFYKSTSRTGFKSLFTNMTKDPALREAYQDYVGHGGGHKYSLESEAQRALKDMMHQLDTTSRVVLKSMAAPAKIPIGFVNWMFEQYIPSVKFGKYMDALGQSEAKLGRPMTSAEKIETIKELQNFYGMMNERLFGRSGTLTTALRFVFMAPGYAEGNARTMIKAATQWGTGKDGYKASRSRANIVNSWVLTATLATVGTIILTGKPPKEPESLEEVRDLLKIDTGKKDQYGDRIMIDLASYDKDYWDVYFNVLRGRPDVAISKSFKRLGGMKATSFQLIHDVQSLAMGKAIYDWKEDLVYHPTDPFVEKMTKLLVHEIKRLEPISVSVFSQSKRKDIDTSVAIMESLIGLRTTYDESALNKRSALRDCWDLRGKREELAWKLGQYKDPWAAVEYYNGQVKELLSGKFVPQSMREEWSHKLLVDPKKVINWKHFPPHTMTVPQIHSVIASHTYEKPYRRDDGTVGLPGMAHKGYEERIASLEAELVKRGVAKSKWRRAQQNARRQKLIENRQKLIENRRTAR